MRVAVIGGGASGLAAAWLLDEVHDVTLFEREATLGGHIRTLGGNVSCEALPPGVHLDAGVIEFDRGNFPAFHAWMKALGVVMSDLEPGGTTSLYLADGRQFHSPAAIGAEHPAVRDRLADLVHLVPLALRRRRFLRAAAQASHDDLAASPVERFLSDDEFSTWVRCLLMYAYSVHYEEVGHLSAAVVVPMLREFLQPTRWTHLPAGVSSYLDRVSAVLRGRIVLGARLACVLREAGGATVVHEDGHRERFEVVVVAVPPHRVLGLLGDASEEERAWFGEYRGGPIQAVVHTDTGPYDRRAIHAPSEFDLFELASGGHGYNAYLNRLAGLGDAYPVHYGLAFDLGSEIDPAKVVHRQVHDVASYSERALAARDDLRRANGRRATYFAGAFLGDGLHEGAIRSALDVAARLGGRSLPGLGALSGGSDPP